MEKLSVADAAKKIQRYLERDTLLPYFVVTDSQNGEDLKNFFGDFSWLYVSDFCAGDSFLDVDLFIERLNALETDGLIFGLGEYVYFSGQENIVRAMCPGLKRTALEPCFIKGRDLRDLGVNGRKIASTLDRMSKLQWSGRIANREEALGLLK